MIFEFSLFGFPIWSFTFMHVEMAEGEEYISNNGGDFERREIPFGFSALPYEEEYEEEDGEDE